MAIVNPKVTPSLLLAFGCGVVLIICFDSYRRMSGQNHFQGDRNYPLFPVTVTHVAPEDEWLVDYDVFLAPAEHNGKDTDHAILLLSPRNKPTTLPARSGVEFDLTGVGLGVKPVSLNPKLFGPNAGQPDMTLLDYSGEEISARSLAGETLRLQYRPSR